MTSVTRTRAPSTSKITTECGRRPRRAQMTPPAFSLAHLTAVVLSPPELIRVAARTGYSTVGLRLIAVTPDSPGYPLMDDPAGLRETKAAIAETGVNVLDIEFVRITPEIDVEAL